MLLTRIIAWLNVPANALGKFLLAPISVLPGWLSATMISAATGLLLLVVFKYTSNQRAIRRVRDDIKAHLLALKLFSESVPVTLRAEGRVFRGAVLLLLLSIVPMLVMVVPVSLLLGQLALWYQSRPLSTGEEAVITVKLNGSSESPWREVTIKPTSGVAVVLGPVRARSKREILWIVKGRETGYHRVLFEVDGHVIEKELAVGDTFMRLSSARPGWIWSEILLHPCERPLGPDAPIRSIEIDYPDRISWTSGTNSWVIYWFVVSMIAALCFRPLIKVNI
jgi:hypothetical protein